MMLMLMMAMFSYIILNFSLQANRINTT